MKQLSTVYKNSVIGKQVNTLATCFRVELQDGRRMGFTTHTRDITFTDDPTLTYKTASFTPTASSKSSQMNVDNMDVDLLIDHNDIQTDDLEKGIWNNAKVYIFRVNWAIKPFIYANIDKVIKGSIGEMERHKLTFRTEFRSQAQYLQNSILDETKSSCNALFGDARCGVDKSLHTFTDSVDGIINNKMFVCDTLNNADGDFDYGIIEFTSGQAIGKKMEVKKWTQATKTIELQLSLNYPIESGDTFKIIRGCDKLKKTCKDKYNNLLNFRGFSFIPGLDKMTGGNVS